MDKYKFLVLLRDKNSEDFRDATNELKTCYEQETCFKLTFERQEKIYSYKKKDVLFLTHPTTVDVNQNDIFINDAFAQNIIKILSFGAFYKVFFQNGTEDFFENKKVQIEEIRGHTQDFIKRFDYLKEVSKVRIIPANEMAGYLNRETSSLERQLNTIGRVCSRSFLSKYLESGCISRFNYDSPIIFPFGFNLSQKIAVENALHYNGSIIEGPPGTGKTQTILNIICNLILSNQSMVVVSNNNAALQNVKDKLEKHGLGFLCAFLGNRQNTNSFFSDLPALPSIFEWCLSEEAYQELMKNVQALHHQLTDLLEKKNKEAICRSELSLLKTEYSYFLDNFDKAGSFEVENITCFKYFPKDLFGLKVDLVIYQKQQKRLTLGEKIRLFLKYRIIRFEKLQNHLNGIMDSLEDAYYRQKIADLKKRNDELNQFIELNNYNELLNAYIEDSMKAFKATLAKRFFEYKPIVFTKQTYKHQFEAFMKRYPVVLSTTHSVRLCKSDEFLWDYVIIDESSQVDLVSGSLALLSGKNVCVVGDLKQLPHIIQGHEASQLQEIFDSFQIPKEYNLVTHSLMLSVSEIFGEAIPKVTLREHYRCHPQIIQYCNEKFYGGQLIIQTEGHSADQAMVIVKAAPGNHARSLIVDDIEYSTSTIRTQVEKFNRREIDIIIHEVLPNLDWCPSLQEIGIATPYRKQKECLQRAIPSCQNIEIDTVHKYQGREKNVMVMSCVANEVNDFISNPNLINVAVSRAVNRFIIVVSDSIFCSHGNNLGDLLRYIKYTSCDSSIKESQIVSVFDLLYSEYSDKLKEIQSKIKEVSGFFSENAMNYVIENALKESTFDCFKHTLHYPLRHLIRDTAVFSFDEVTYLKRSGTHIDFLIYSRFDKSPVLAIELDSVTYHDNNPNQLKRDALKNSILEKAGIPLLRVYNHESDVKKRVIRELKKIQLKSK